MNLKLNADRFTGKEYVNIYNHYRPAPPVDIIQQSLNYLNKSKGLTIIDIGCGTGISTRVWSDYAEKIIGVEPSEEMVGKARELTKNTNIKYQQGYSNATNLESNSADIISCSQSFHWMEPKSTLKEIDRLLKDNGVLVIYDVIWPPSVNHKYEKAYHELFEKVSELTSKLGEEIAIKWNKKEHLKNIESSNYFQYTKESYYHKKEKFDKEKFTGIALSQGGLEALIKRGFTTEEIGLNHFRKEIKSIDELVYDSMTYNYRVIYGIK